MAPPKPTSPFYKELKALDYGIAERWKRATNDNPNRVLDFDMIVPILGWSWKTEVDNGHKIKLPVYDKRLNGDQAKAIALLLDKMDETSKRLFLIALNQANEAGKLFYGGRLYAPNDVKRVTDFILPCAHAIAWRSPGSNFSYAPPQYFAVGALIKMQEIGVDEHSSGGLGKVLTTAAAYDASENLLILDKTRSDAELRYSVLHEMTHAVQDWYDLMVIRLYTEADAYICGAVAARTTGQRVFKGNALHDAAFAAAEFVFSKSAHISNVQWVYAYGAVVSEVEKSYPNARTLPQNQEVRKDGSMTEPEKIEAVIRELAAEAERGRRKQLEKGPPIPIR